MAKPTNYNDKNCESTSSDCVIWNGRDISCLKLCNGDSITKVTEQIATNLCTIMDELDISNYDLKCLELQGCTVKDFKTFINVLITKVCAIADAQSGATPSIGSRTAGSTLAQDQDCPNCFVDLAPCFRYTDPATGDLVTTGLVQDYVKLIAIAVCNLISQATTQSSVNESFNTRITNVENAQNNAVPYSLPQLFPTCIGDPVTSLPLDQFVASLEQQFCLLMQATGTPTEIYGAISTPPSDINSRAALGTGGGTMGSKAGWVQDPQDLADSLTNLWISYLDLYSAVKNMTINNNACEGIVLDLNATLENKILKLYFTGTIPSNFESCVIGGSIFKIQDQSGNYVNTQVDILNNVNNISGVSIDLNSTPINFADDLTVSSVYCFNDKNTGSTCQNFVEKLVNNNVNCPTLTLIPGMNSVTYSFNHSSGTLTYYIQLFNDLNVMVQSQAVTVNAPAVISNEFVGLNSNSTYKIRLQMVTASNTKTCPFTPFVTLPNPCGSPTAVSAIFA